MKTSLRVGLATGLALCLITSASFAQPANPPAAHSGANAAGQDGASQDAELLPTPRGVASQAAGQEPAQELNQEPPKIGVHLGESAGGGVLITGVVPGSPAANVGLVRGDYIMMVGELKVSAPDEVAPAIVGAVENDRIVLQIWRDARKQEFIVDLRNVGPVVQSQPRGRSNSNQRRYYDTGPRYYNNSYDARLYNGNRAFYGSSSPYGYPYYSTRGPRDYLYGPGYGYPGYGYGYPGFNAGPGVYVNGNRGGVNVGGFSVRW